MKAVNITLFRYILLLTGLLVLSACSGGGGKDPITDNDGSGGDTPVVDNGGSGGDQPPINDDGTYSIDIDTDILNFSASFFEASSLTKDVEVTFEGDGLLAGFASINETVNWLSFETITSTDTTATIRFSIDHFDTEAQTALIPNNYQTTFRLTTGDISSNTFVSHDIEINLAVWPTAFNFDGVQTNNLTMQELTLDATNFEWTLTKSGDIDWLTISSEIINGVQTVSVTPNTSALTSGGEYNGTVTISQTGTTETTTIPVSLLLDDARLYSNANGIGLFQLSDSENLSETINVLTNNLGNIAWQATSNTDWLTLTPDSISNTLQIAKNDNVLTDGQHFSEVTIQSTTNGVTAQQIIYVGYYQSTNAKTVSTLEKLDGSDNIFDIPDFNKIVFDPIRSLFYLTDESSLTSYHLFTGEKVDEISLPIKTINSEDVIVEFSNLAMSPNGQFLLASAIITQTVPNTDPVMTTEQLYTYKLDLSNNTFNDSNLTEVSLSGEDKLSSVPIFIGQIDGKEIVVTNELELAEFDTNTSLNKLYETSETETYNIAYIQQASNTNELFFVQNILDDSADNLQPIIFNRAFTYHQFKDIKVSLTDGFNFLTPTINVFNFFDVNANGNTIYSAQLDNEITTINDDNEATFEGAINTSNNYVEVVDIEHAINGHSYYSHFNDGTPLTLSITEYDEQLIQVGEPSVIPNASDSIFILPTFKRLVTREPRVEGEDDSEREWFITSFN